MQNVPRVSAVNKQGRAQGHDNVICTEQKVTAGVPEKEGRCKSPRTTSATIPHVFLLVDASIMTTTAENRHRLRLRLRLRQSDRHLPIHTFKPKYEHTYERPCTHANVHACEHAYIHANVHTYEHAYIHANIHAFMYDLTRPHVHFYVCLCTRAKTPDKIPSRTEKTEKDKKEND